MGFFSLNSIHLRKVKAGGAAFCHATGSKADPIWGMGGGKRAGFGLLCRMTQGEMGVI
jgi:hypothetical protein